ncbi:MAG: GAF domain-containing SpoIIE family protein phosphatase [Candidatus Acidiferrales bacterium]
MSETAPQLRPSAAPAKQSPTDEPQKSLLTNIEQDQSLSLLFDVSRELTSILGRDELLQRIADRVKKLVNYHLFMVMLWNELTQQLECAFTRHYEEQFAVRLSVPLFKGITGHAAGTRLPVRVDDIRLDQRYIEFPHSDNVRSEMVIPLLLHDRLVGVLDLESTQLGAFTLEHERMLGIVGTYIAIALENSRLYELSRDRELAMESDLDTAREIQRQLLPQDKRAVPGLDVASAYVPARQLGGDFYDFVHYGTGRLGVALGDVSGKGTAAALYGSLTVGIFREYTQDHRCWPEEMLGVLNTRLNAARMSPNYVCFLFAVYDAGQRQLIVANAGAPRPVLVRGGDIRELKVDGTPLGIFPEMDYETLTFTLEPDDVLIFASDGITESMNAADEPFGLDRLAQALRNLPPGTSAEKISCAILEATDEFSGRPTEAHDDRTLVVLRAAASSPTNANPAP